MDLQPSKEQQAEATLQAFAIMAVLKEALGDKCDAFYKMLKENDKASEISPFLKEQVW